MTSNPEFRIGVLASGGGTTFEAVQEVIAGGKLPGIEIGLVICNNGPSNPDAEVWERAQRLGVDIVHVSNLTEDTCTLPEIDRMPVSGTISYEVSERFVTLARTLDLKAMVGLGFMKRVIGPALQELPFLNEHPGPLGAQLLTAGEYGTAVQEKVMRDGLDYSGPTMHWMDRRTDANGLPMYDTGPEVGHEPVPVTDEMRAEWDEHGTVNLLKTEVMRIERLMVPRWISLAMEQL